MLVWISFESFLLTSLLRFNRIGRHWRSCYRAERDPPSASSAIMHDFRTPVCWEEQAKATPAAWVVAGPANEVRPARRSRAGQQSIQT